MAYEIEWLDGGVCKVFTGAVTMAELLGSLSDVQRNPLYGSLKYTITDFRRVEKIYFSEREMMQYGAHVVAGSVRNKDLVIGIVTTDPALIGILKERYEHLVRYPVAYFATVEECSKWILKMTHFMPEPKSS